MRLLLLLPASAAAWTFRLAASAVAAERGDTVRAARSAAPGRDSPSHAAERCSSRLCISLSRPSRDADTPPAVPSSPAPARERGASDGHLKPARPDPPVSVGRRTTSPRTALRRRRPKAPRAALLRPTPSPVNGNASLPLADARRGNGVAAGTAAVDLRALGHLQRAGRGQGALPPVVSANFAARARGHRRHHLLRTAADAVAAPTVPATRGCGQLLRWLTVRAGGGRDGDYIK